MRRWHCGSHERKERIMFTEMMMSGSGGVQIREIPIITSLPYEVNIGFKPSTVIIIPKSTGTSDNWYRSVIGVYDEESTGSRGNKWFYWLTSSNGEYGIRNENLGTGLTITDNGFILDSSLFYTGRAYYYIAY